jgi:hypothetical protein
MKFNCYTNKYKEKFILLPLAEFAWHRKSNVLNIKFGLFSWTIKFSFNF